MNVVAVVQSRLGSSRLPGKMMYPLSDRPVIYHVLRRVNQSPVLDDVVLATTTKKHDELLALEAKNVGTDVYRGSESDVLRRVYNAAASTEADIIVRICADNPLISPKCVTEVANTVITENIDYAGYSVNRRTLPLGVTAEAFSLESFKMVESNTEEEYEREHVTTFYKENPSEFSVTHLDAEDTYEDVERVARPELRLTLDTVPDYKLMSKVYQNVTSNSSGIIGLCDAIEYINSNELSEINKHVKQKRAVEDG